MKRLDTLIGKVERFFINYFIYLNAKNIIFAHNHHYKQYLGINISEEVLNDAKSIISVWKGKDYR
jgi:hypothetical protein